MFLAHKLYRGAKFGELGLDNLKEYTTDHPVLNDIGIKSAATIVCA